MNTHINVLEWKVNIFECRSLNFFIDGMTKLKLDNCHRQVKKSGKKLNFQIIVIKINFTHRVGPRQNLYHVKRIVVNFTNL